MHSDRRRQGRCRPESVQRVVLVLTLASYPHWSAMRALKLAIGCGGVTHHAIRELVAIGLMEREGGSVRPTPAAAHFERLKLP